MAVRIYRADQATPLYPQKLALTLPTSGGRSVGIVRSRIKSKELSYVYQWYIQICWACRTRTVKFAYTGYEEPGLVEQMNFTIIYKC
jgi:hypothetical protein